MAIVRREQVKKHLRLSLEDASEDDILDLYGGAAEDAVSQYLNRPIPWQDGGGQDLEVPRAVVAAILLTIGDLYENREGAFIGTIHTVNPTVRSLLNPYREEMGV